MSTAMTLFGAGGQVPAHISKMAERLGGNIPDRQSTPSLTYTGKTWTVSKDGKKQQLMTRNAEGDEVPLTVMRVIILDAALRRGRSYYEGAYDPNNVSQPRCWSSDGEAPSEHVKEPFAAKCASCPWSAKGSKVNERGDSVVACSQHRMLAVVPSQALGIGALRLKIAITSDYDKESPDQNAEGWFSFQDYKNWLKSQGIDHTARVVTKIKFDTTAEYPKLMFCAEKWVDEANAERVIELVEADETKKLLTDSWTPAGVDGVKAPSDEAEQTKPEPRLEKPAAKAAAKPAPKKEPEPEPELIIEAEEPAATKPAPADDDGGMILMGDDEPQPVTKPAKGAATAKPSKVVAESAPQASTDVPDEIADLLADWGA